MSSPQSWDFAAWIPQWELQRPYLIEAYKGTDIVAWQGMIGRQLDKLLADAEKVRNLRNSDKLREFIKIWRDNQITGSINRETVKALETACSMLGVDEWNLKNYFSVLRDQLRVLLASLEELPMMEPQPQKIGGKDSSIAPTLGGAGAEEPMQAGAGVPPQGQFGPEETPGQNEQPPDEEDMKDQVDNLVNATSAKK